jgi:hypothetical protein
MTEKADKEEDAIVAKVSRYAHAPLDESKRLPTAKRFEIVKSVGSY